MIVFEAPERASR